MRRKPYSVILFDEIEKAHPLVFNMFLQIFDAGRLTDGQGRVVDFRNTVLIMTSNLGGDIIRKATEGKNHSTGMTESVQQQIWEIVQNTFPPEFINRLDQIIMFDPLNKDQIRKIVDLQIQLVENRLAQQNIQIHVSEKAKDVIADKGFDPIYGARPLKRVIENEILDEVAMMIVENTISEGDTIKVVVKDKDLHIFKSKIQK